MLLQHDQLGTTFRKNLTNVVGQAYVSHKR